MGAPGLTDNLTVYGTISSTSVIYASGGNSNQWNSTYTTVQNNSANWQPSESFEIESDGVFYPTSFINIRPTRPEINLLPFTRYGTYSFTNLISSQFTSFEGTIQLNSEIKNPTKYFNFKNLEYFNGGIAINSFASLTGLTFPDLKACTQGITIASNNALSSINLNELVYVGSGLTIGGYAAGLINENLQTIDFPKLVFVGGSFLAEGYRATAGHSSPLREVNLPALEVVGNANSFTLGSLNFGNTTFPLITSISLSSLKMVGDLSLRRCPNLVSLNLPSLIRMSVLQLNESTNLRNIDLPELRVIGGYIFNTVPNVTAVSMPKLEILTSTSAITLNTSTLSSLEFGTDTLRQALASYTFNTTLNQTSVNNLLKAYARLDGTGLTQSYGTSRTLSIAGSNKAPSYTGGVTTTSAGTNFVRTGTTVVASVVGHGHTTGDIVTFTGNTQSNLNGTYTVTVNSVNQFQYTTTGSGNLTGGGTVTMRRTTVATDGFRYFQTIALRGATVTINFP